MDADVFIFDACAVLALLNLEPGAEVAAEILENGENHCLIHAINACEVYYGLHPTPTQAATPGPGARAPVTSG